MDLAGIEPNTNEVSVPVKSEPKPSFENLARDQNLGNLSTEALIDGCGPNIAYEANPAYIVEGKCVGLELAS